MAKHLHLFLTLAAVAGTLAAQGPGAHASPKASQLANLTFQEKTFHSDAVGKDMPYGIFLPKDYDAPANQKKEWPLVIWLHGMFEDHMRFHDRGGAPVLDKAIADGSLPPCVFVLANGGRTSLYVNRDKEKWEDLIKKDLLDHVLQNYRVSKDPHQRALMGISLGGMAALRIAFQQPKLFGTVAVHSAAIFPANAADLPKNLLQMGSRFGMDEVFGNPIDQKKWEQANPLCIAATLDAKALEGLRIRFDAGTDDRLHLAPGNEELHKVLDGHKVTHTWELVQGGGHAWGSGFKEESLLKSLAFVGEAFARAAGTHSALDGLVPAGTAKPDGKDKTGAEKPAGGGK